MDADSTRSILAVSAGVLTFCGAVISFVNSRMNEARSRDQKRAVLHGALRIADTVWFLAGSMMWAFTAHQFAGLIVAGSSGILFMVIYFQSSTKELKWDILQLVVRACSLSAMLCIGLLNRIIDVQEKQIGNLERLINSLK